MVTSIKSIVTIRSKSSVCIYTYLDSKKNIESTCSKYYNYYYKLVETKAPAAIKAEGHVRQPPARLEISYHDGTYLVGDQPFPTRKAAQQYQEMLALADPVPAEK